MNKSTSGKVSVFGIEIDRLSLGQAVDHLNGWIASGDRCCRYVVTPNLDHVVQFQRNADLRSAYKSASMVVADGWPLVTASRFFGESLPERVAGSDLVPALLNSSCVPDRRRTVFLLGAAAGVGDVAASKIEERWPSVKVVGAYSPPFGFEHDSAECSRIVEEVNRHDSDMLIVGFGAPKQELWLQRFHKDLSVGVAVAAGATIDFLAGRQTRAPVWMQKMKLEWSHRLMTNPRRLAGRYAMNAFELPRLVVRECFERHRQGVRKPVVS